MRKAASRVLHVPLRVDRIPDRDWVEVACAAVDLVTVYPSRYRPGSLVTLVGRMASTGFATAKFAAVAAAAAAAEAALQRLDERGPVSAGVIDPIEPAEREQLDGLARGLQAVLEWPAIGSTIDRYGAAAHSLLRGRPESALRVGSHHAMVWVAASALATEAVMANPHPGAGPSLEEFVHAVSGEAGALAASDGWDHLGRWSAQLSLVAERLADVASAVPGGSPVLSHAAVQVQDHASALGALHDAVGDVRQGDPTAFAAAASPRPLVSARQALIQIALSARPEHLGGTGTVATGELIDRLLTVALNSLRHGDAAVVAELPVLLREMTQVAAASTTLWGAPAVTSELLRLERAAALSRVPPAVVAMREVAARVWAGGEEELANVPVHELAPLVRALTLMGPPPHADSTPVPEDHPLQVDQLLTAAAGQVVRRGTAGDVRAVLAAVASAVAVDAALVDILQSERTRERDSALTGMMGWDESALTRALGTAARLLDQPGVAQARRWLHDRGKPSAVVSRTALVAAAALLVGEPGMDPSRCLRLMGHVARTVLVTDPATAAPLAATMREGATVLAVFGAARVQGEHIDEGGAARLAAHVERIVAATPDVAAAAREALAALETGVSGDVPAAALGIGLPLALLRPIPPVVGGHPLTVQRIVAIWRRHIRATLAASSASRDAGEAAAMLEVGGPILEAVEGIINVGGTQVPVGIHRVLKSVAQMQGSLSELATGNLGVRPLASVLTRLRDASVKATARSDPSEWPDIGAALVMSAALSLPMRIPPTNELRKRTTADVAGFANWVVGRALHGKVLDQRTMEEAARTVTAMAGALSVMAPFLGGRDASYTRDVRAKLKSATEYLDWMLTHIRAPADPGTVAKLWAGTRLSGVAEDEWVAVVAQLAHQVGRSASSFADPRLAVRRPGELLSILYDLVTDLVGECCGDRVEGSPWSLARAPNVSGTTERAPGVHGKTRLGTRAATAGTALVMARRMLAGAGPAASGDIRTETRDVGEVLRKLKGVLEHVEEFPEVLKGFGSAQRAAAPYLLGQRLTIGEAPDVELIAQGALLLDVGGSPEATLGRLRELCRTLSASDTPPDLLLHGCVGLMFASRSMDWTGVLRQYEPRDLVADATSFEPLAEGIASQVALLWTGLFWRSEYRASRPKREHVASLWERAFGATTPGEWKTMIVAAAVELDAFETTTPLGHSRRLCDAVKDLTDHVMATGDELKQAAGLKALEAALIALEANASVCDAERLRVAVDPARDAVLTAMLRLGWEPPGGFGDDGGRDGPWWGPGGGGDDPSPVPRGGARPDGGGRPERPPQEAPAVGSPGALLHPPYPAGEVEVAALMRGPGRPARHQPPRAPGPVGAPAIIAPG